MSKGVLQMNYLQEPASFTPHPPSKPLTRNLLVTFSLRGTSPTTASFSVQAALYIICIAMYGMANHF